MNLNNDLKIQREYFDLIVQAKPRDETFRFALAQILKDMGHDEEANRVYDEGIALANRLWFPKLFVFTILSVSLALIIWLLGAKWLWLLIPVTLLGPAIWIVIRRNRHKWLPQVGFWQRQQTIRSLDLRNELAGVRQMKGTQQDGPTVFSDSRRS